MSPLLAPLSAPFMCHGSRKKHGGFPSASESWSLLPEREELHGAKAGGFVLWVPTQHVLSCPMVPPGKEPIIVNNAGVIYHFELLNRPLLFFISKSQ